MQNPLSNYFLRSFLAWGLLDDVTQVNEFMTKVKMKSRTVSDILCNWEILQNLSDSFRVR